ncbi:MAG TPA: cell division protein ZapA [Bacillus bacterium]|nr:cell division protein ZapA [Bacillus sp. (in: firmicutes)]
MSEQNRKRISVDIYGHQYTIIGDENSSDIRLVASMVDSKMKEISQCNPCLDTNKLAILTAVNIVNDYLKLKAEHDTLKRDYESLLIKLEQKEEKLKNG